MFIFTYIVLITFALGGGLSALLIKKNNLQLLKIVLSFSGAYIFAIILLHLIPEVYESAKENHSLSTKIGLYILLGFVIQLILEQFSSGVEHGHLHVFQKLSLPVGIMLSLCIHSFMEGLPLIDDNLQNSNFSPFLIGILMHKIPEAFALMSVLIKAQIKKGTSIFFLFIFSLMTPLGAFLGNIIQGSKVNESAENYSQIILAIVIGLLLHVSTTILFESSENHRFGIFKIFAIIAGIILGYLLLIL